MEKINMNVLGKNISIMPNAFITKIIKINDEIVKISKINQNGCGVEYPIYVKKDFNITAEEFIKEFDKENNKICSEFDKENNLGNNYQIYLDNK
jgi:hypothetical protein